MGFSWTTFVFELINFGLFLWLLQRMLYRPLQKTIRERRQQQEQAERLVSDLEERARLLAAQQAEEHAVLAEERQRVLAEARADALRERSAILKRTEAEQTDLRRRERENLTRERTEAEQETARASLEAGRASAESLLRALLVPEMNELMIRRLVDAMMREPGESREDGDAELQCATPLSREQRAQLSQAIARQLGKQISLRFTVEPKLISGLRLRLGNTIYDTSIKTQMDHVVSEARRKLGLEVAGVSSALGA